MNKLIKTLYSLPLVLVISSCVSGINSSETKEQESDYLSGSVKMDIKKFFDGDLEGFAIKQDENGKIIETFTAKINGRWDENKGIVQFKYYRNDGIKDSRTWLITVNNDNSFEGVGHEITKPVSGKQIGNLAKSNYSINFGTKDAKEEINFEEKMYLIDDKSAIVISNFKSKKSQKNTAGKIIFSIKKLSTQQ
jgi:hypothetical protein